MKGYRYELWCLARAAGIRYCLVIHSMTFYGDFCFFFLMKIFVLLLIKRGCIQRNLKSVLNLNIEIYVKAVINLFAFLSVLNLPI